MVALPLEHFYRNRPLILGHRGASAYAPENTLAAFRLALAQGADGFELDVALSADGVPVVIHDDSVDRTTDGTGPVGALTLAEVKALRAGFPARFGSAFAAESVPTLAEVFEAFGRQALINVELKHDHSPGRQLAARVLALIRQHGLEQRVIVSSFQLTSLKRMRQLAPDVPLAVLYESPRHAARVTRCLNPVLGAAPEAHHPAHARLTAEIVSAYHAQGYRINTWTVNEADDMRRLAAMGVDGLVSDRPDVAVAVRADLGRG